jgi:hypothetical protein
VNAVVHLLVAAGRREYNPGLLTAATLFVPLTVWSAIEINAPYDVSTGINLLALGVAILGHVAIVAAIGVHLARSGGSEAAAGVQ